MQAPKINTWLDHYLAVAVAALDPVPGKQFVLAGGEVPWDQCDCNGQVWSRVVGIVPNLGPTKAGGRACNVQWWEATLAVGVLRCVAVPTESGKLPTGTKMSEDGHKFGNDLANLLQAIMCDDKVYTITAGTPLGAQGGCAGSEVQFIVRINPCPCD